MGDAQPAPPDTDMEEDPDAWRASVPPGIKTSEAEADALLDGKDDYYKPLTGCWSSGDHDEIEIGNKCLWQGIKKTKSGGPSSAKEYFHGNFHGWMQKDPTFAWMS